MSASRLGPVVPALGAAVLFGASAPIIKYTLGEVAPIPLAALLYLGSGLGLLLLRLAMRISRTGGASEAGRRSAGSADVQPESNFRRDGITAAQFRGCCDHNPGRDHLPRGGRGSCLGLG